MGRLSLQFEYDARSARTRLNVIGQEQPLKVVRAFHVAHGGVLVHLHNLSGGVLGGDRLTSCWEVGPAAHAQLTSTGATRIYRSRPGAGPARSSCRVQVREDALIEYLPDPLIPFAGAVYEQQTVIDLDRGAGLFWWETVAPGREARGELFSYDALKLEFELRAQQQPVAIERNLLAPLVRPMASSARLGCFRYFSSFYICRVGTGDATWRALEKQLLDITNRLSSPVITWGLSRLPAHGFVVRALSLTGREIAAGLVEYWQAAKQMLYGHDAVIPRKIY